MYINTVPKFKYFYYNEHMVVKKEVKICRW